MMPPPSPQTSKWIRMQLALFLLAVPSLSLGEIQTNTAYHTDTATLLLRKKVTISNHGNKKFHELDASAEFKEDESTEFDSIDFDDDNIVESEMTDVHRDLSSDSNSRDEADDFWRNPKYWDDYNNPVDDEFYRYNGDSDRPHLNPIGERDMVGFMLASLGATLGSLGGIGGGGLVVPCYVIVTRLNLKQAIPLGSVTVLGGSLAALMLNLKRRHPLADRPIIDWDLILVMEPLVLVGTLFGSILHRVVTGKILSVLLVLLLSIVAHTTLVKARRMFNAEKRYIEHLRKSQLDYLTRVQSFRTAAAWGAGLEAAESRASYLPAEPTRTLSMDSQTIATATQAPISPRMNIHEKQRILILNPDFVTLRSDLMEQEKVTPRSKILLLLSKFSVLMFLNIMLGGGAFKSPWGIQCGGFAYWIVHIIMVAFLFSSAWAAQTYLTNRHELKEIIRFDYVHGDIKWDQRRSVVYPLFFMLAGLLAGMFGIGGGMITVPLMLAMGVHPAICTATSSTMVFFTVLLSSSSYAIFNLILWDYAVVCFFIGFIGSLIGNGIMHRVRQKESGVSSNFERNSFIAFGTGYVIMLCAFSMTLQYVIQIALFHDYTSEREIGVCAGYRLN